MPSVFFLLMFSSYLLCSGILFSPPNIWETRELFHLYLFSAKEQSLDTHNKITSLWKSIKYIIPKANYATAWKDALADILLTIS